MSGAGSGGCDVTLTLSAALGDGMASAQTIQGSVVVPRMVSTLLHDYTTTMQFGGGGHSAHGEELQFSVATVDFNSSESRKLCLAFPDIRGKVEIDLKTAPDAGAKRWHMHPQWAQFVDHYGPVDPTAGVRPSPNTTTQHTRTPT